MTSDAPTAGSTLVQGGKPWRAQGYAAEICEDVGFELSKGALECSKATAERQKVSERWLKGGGLMHLSIAATSDSDSTKRRVISRLQMHIPSRVMQRSHSTAEKTRVVLVVRSSDV